MRLYNFSILILLLFNIIPGRLVFFFFFFFFIRIPCSFANYTPLLTSIVPCFLPFQVMETNRAEESQSHIHRMYFMGPNSFSEPWHLSHTPAEEIKEIV